MYEMALFCSVFHVHSKKWLLDAYSHKMKKPRDFRGAKSLNDDGIS